jgi:hypothetical protein
MPKDHDSLFYSVEDAQVADARQDTIESLERSCETFSQRFNVNSEIELKIMRHFLLAGQISEKLAQANVKGW